MVCRWCQWCGATFLSKWKILISAAIFKLFLKKVCTPTIVLSYWSIFTVKNLISSLKINLCVCFWIAKISLLKRKWLFQALLCFVRFQSLFLKTLRLIFWNTTLTEISDVLLNEGTENGTSKFRRQIVYRRTKIIFLQRFKI